MDYKTKRKALALLITMALFGGTAAAYYAFDLEFIITTNILGAGSVPSTIECAYGATNLIGYEWGVDGPFSCNTGLETDSNVTFTLTEALTSSDPGCTWVSGSDLQYKISINGLENATDISPGESVTLLMPAGSDIKIYTKLHQNHCPAPASSFTITGQQLV